MTTLREDVMELPDFGKASKLYKEAVGFQNIVLNFDNIVESVVYDLMDMMGIDREDLVFDIILEALENRLKFDELVNRLESGRWLN